MKSNNIKYIEDSLKRYIKKSKDVSYTTALLVTFLITGFISYSSETVQMISTRSELAEKILNEKFRVSTELKEAEKNIKDIDLKIEKLMRRGKFWVKPLEDSYQIFFNFNWHINSKNRNRTKFNFNGSEYKSSPSLLSSIEKETYYDGIYYGIEGIIKNPLEFIDNIDFGANINPKKVEEKTVIPPTVRKTEVKLAQITEPVLPNISVTAPVVTAPTAGSPITPTAPNINITAPGAITPLGQITVTEIAPLNVNITTPTISEPLAITAPNVQAPATPAGFTPRLITPPEQPLAPTSPSIDLFSPFNISFNGTGFGQPSGKSMPKSNIILQNYATYNTTGSGFVNITAGSSGTSWSGETITTEGGNLTNGSTGSPLNAFISHVDDWDTALNGKYNFTGNNGGNNTKIFASINPYYTQNATRTFDFKGILDLHGNGGGGTEALVGFEHQLLANGGGGGSNYPNVNKPNGATSILKNSGKINLKSGTNMVGIMMDTEYFNGKRLGNQNSAFVSLPKVINAGSINILSGATKSVAIDYGYFYPSEDGGGPNTTVSIGEINIEGTNNYGIRLKDYSTQPCASYGRKSPKYYDFTRLEGTVGKSITVKGTNNIGLSIAQGRSSGDPLGGYAHLGDDGVEDNADLIASLNVTVGGENNVGFYRNPNYEGKNHTAMELNGSRIGEFKFTANAKKSTLFRSDFDEIKLTKNISLTEGNTGNSFMQAGSTVVGRAGTVTNAATLTSSLPTFYGLTAGDFASSIGAVANNTGSLTLSGDHSIGMAIATGNTGNNSGNITLNAKEGSAIYNKGTFNLTDGNIIVDGAKASGVYNAAGTTNISSTVRITAKNGAAGIYASGGTVNSTSGANLYLTSEAGEGLAAYAGGGTINLTGATVNVINSAAGVASSGAASMVNLTNANMTYDGKGYAVYSTNGGKVNLSGTKLTLKGSSTAFDVDLGAATLPVTLDGNTRINANSDDVIAFNLANATGLTTVGGIETSIKSKIETKLALGPGSLNNLFAGSTSTKYKVAAVDGGEITIGNLDKSGTSTDTEQAKKDGYEYYNRFLAQRLKATANGSTIKAVLSSSFANDNFNGQVVGFEMNSSKKTTGVDDTAINLENNSKIIADRTDAGAGAIGAFINYGLVNIDATSKIEVEKENNVINKQAVGVYAVNGSKVNNKGTIDVGGDQSVGILGMAYREDDSHNPIVNEFGGKPGEGTVNITNEKDIKMSGKDAIGIYAMNNNTSPVAVNHLVINKGTVEVGDSDQKTAVGIYAKGVDVKPEGGTIKIGEKAIGIYALDSEIGEAGKNLGTVEFKGNKGIAIYLTGDKNKAKLNGTEITLANPNSKEENVGIFIDYTANGAAYETAVKVNTGNSNNITAYYTNSGDLKVKANGKINENSTGITGVEGKKLTYGDGTGNFSFEIGKNSTGILAKKSDVDLKDKATLKLTGENSVGVYLDSDNTNKTANIAGKIEFENSATKSVGVYVLNGTTVNELSKDIVTFGASNNNIGYYIAGSEWKGNPNGTDITYNHNSKNIFIYAQGSKATDGTYLGSTVKPYAAINVNPAGTSTAAEKAIGIYLDTSVKGEAGKFVDNDLNLEEGLARINVTKEGIGAYAKNISTDKYNKVTLPKISSEGDKTVGVYTDGNLKLVRIGNISASDKGIGIYANKGKIVLEDVQNIELTDAGTGLYLTNGSYLDGNKIVLKNNTTGTPAAGVYYTKGSSTTQVNHNTEIEVNDGNDALALYVDGGIDLKNNKAITISKNKGNVAAFITRNSKFTNNGNITLEGANLTQALGIYVQDGEATNLSGKTLKVKDLVTGSLSVGMAAVKSATGTKAIVNNAGTIEATGDVIAMYVDDNSSGTNSGTISAKNSGNMKALGAYIKGNAAAFKNTGSISSDNIALALEGTTAGKITAGTLNLTESNAVGVYAKNSDLDFDVATTIAAGKEKTVALFAEGNTKIRKKVTSATGKGHVGVYVKDSNVVFETGSKIVVNNGSGTDFGIGIYTDKAFNGNINTKIEQNGSATIGLFLGSDGGTGSTVNYTGSIKVGNGIGVYVPTDSKFVSKDTTFDVNGGTAVFLKGGAVDLGGTGKATINFGTAGGTAIYQDGGIINTGTGLTINGSGSFLALKNADSTINSLVKVGTNGIGINSTYDTKGKDYQLSLGSAGKIQLNGDKATGIAATVTGVSPNKVTIKNEGIIETTAGKQIVGIFAKGAHVENAVNAKINIGEKGIAIFATNEGADADTKLENKGELNLLGNEAIGILANKINTTEAITAGKISGTKDSLIGVYVKDSAAPIEVKDFTISLGNHAKGLVFDGGKDFTVSKTSTNNKVTIGNTTDKAKRGIGIAAIGTSGVVNNTDVTVGTDSLGLYAKGGKIVFNSGKLISSTGSSILAYADKAGEIELNGTGKLSVGTNGIALGTNGGTITTTAITDVEVNGKNGIGAFVVGDTTNAGEISNKFEVKVKSADGIGVYAKGNVTSFAKVTEIKGSNSKGYIFDNLTKAATVTSPLELNDSSATDQIGVYATGTGAGLTINGISVRGLRNIGVYNKSNQNITNNGVLAVGDSSTDNSSIGIFSDNSNETATARSITTNDLLSVGKNSVGIYGKNIAVIQTSAAKDVTVASKGIGILVENIAAYFGKGDVSVAGKANVGADEAIGVQVENANVTLSNDLTVGANKSKGVFSTGKGNINTSGNLTVGADSIGIYKKGTGSETVRTSSGKTLAVGEKAYGIFADKANVDSNTNITVAKEGRGIYVENADLSSVGNVTVGESGFGLSLKSNGSKTLRTTGIHTIGNKKAIGLYVENANIETKAGSSMIIGEGDSVGAFSKGTGNITTDGDITVGKSSIGIYKVGKGNLNIGSLGQNLNIAEKGYGVYYIGVGKTDSKIQSNMNMILGKESVGTYAKGVSVVQNGDITVGETTIGSDGYANPDSNKNSIGIFADTSDVSYKGTMLVDKPLSVGIYGKGAGTITLRSGAILNVRNGGIGIMTGQGVSAINIKSGATINVSGKAKDVDSKAGDKNVSFGITAYSGIIDNKGTINVSGGATGIYLGGTASLLNGATGTIIVDPVTGGTGLGKPTTTEDTGNIGGLRITDAGKVTIGDKVITGGTVKIKGDLSMNGMGLDVSTGKVLIDAQSISGTAYILPNFSKGNSEQKITIKDVFKVSPGGIGAFSGDIKSKSVSWIAKISKEFGDTTTKDITLARIPYNSLITGNKYKNLAAGLEEFRLNLPLTQNSEFFKSLDQISDHGTFAKAVADIRGDVYSNIQERMKTVENVFEKSYSELLDSYNVTKDVNKFSVIHSQGKHEDDTLGVTGYKYKSLGVLYLNDREAYSYGGKYGWSAGIIGNDFDFEGRTNKGSSEKVISGKIGVHYQKALDRKDENAQSKYLSRVELTVNKHKTKRESLIGNDSYHNRASYYSADLSWKNKVFYDYDISTKWSLKPFAGLDLSYGHIWNISESGNGMKLDVKGEDYFVVSPNIGVETKYIIPIGEANRVVVKADAQASYDVTELYDKTNKAKIKGTSSGYYDLSRPEKRRAEGKVGVEIGLEKTDNYGVSLRAEYRENKKSDVNYGVRFNYKF